MWLLRIAKRGRWQDKDPEVGEDVETAAKDLLLRPDESGLSVFRIDDDGDLEAEAEEVAHIFGLTCKPGPENVDFILVPEACLEGLELVQEQDERLHSYLSARHCEVRGLNDEASIELAAKVLRNDDIVVKRVSKRSLRQYLDGAEETNVELQERLGDKWKELSKK